MKTILLALALASAKDYPIQPVPFTAVRVQSEFWTPRMETNRQTTVWYDFKRCEETGRIDNFAKAGKLMPGEFRGTPFDDSDVFKVIEGAAYSLAIQPDPKLDKYLDEIIAKIAAAQEPDGYLYSARTIDPKKREKFHGPTRWSNLAVSHELYNVGHLYEAAVAHFQATGKKTLLNVATKNADMLCETFGPGKVQEPPGHQEIEIGLCKLYRATGQQKYLDLAKYYVELRGREGTHKLRGPYQQDHKPITEQDEAVGHAVRAAYYYSGVADVAALTGDEKLIAAIDRLWENVASKKLYLTGGIGARHGGEAFGDNYELPNATAYNETCAAIANALWNHRMFLLHGDTKYLDVLERTIYNGFLSGVGLTGDEFFYPNPLASLGKYKRSPWFGCACCPVNVVRFLPEIAGYIYAVRDNAAYVNLFIGGTGEVKLPATTVKLTQETRYPWTGAIKITVAPDHAAKFALKLRIPGWAVNKPVASDLYRYIDTPSPREPIQLRVNGQPAGLAMADGFAILDREWKKGDVVELTLPMPVRRVVANDSVKDDNGLVAIERGPIVYCVEEADNGKQLFSLVLGDEVKLTPEHTTILIGNSGTGILPVNPGTIPTGKMPVPLTILRSPVLTMIPYYAWCHRGPGKMNVWLARTPDKAARPTLAGESKPSASHVFAQDHVDALNDGVAPKNSGDHNIPRFTWWDHKGTTEWVQYDFAKPAKVSSVEVYWFDDTGRGACRIPSSWRLLYKSGPDWKPVESASAYGVAKDKFTKLTFTPVETTALRLEVQLQPHFSGGILEWKVE
jgi:DUF1680 family protein